jgi:hypothetical protein
MQTVEPTQAYVGDQQVWRDLIEPADRRLETGANTISWPLFFSSPITGEVSDLMATTRI